MTDPSPEQQRHIDGLMDGVRAAWPMADHAFGQALITETVVANDAFWREVLAAFATELKKRAEREAVLAPGLRFAVAALEGWMRETQSSSHRTRRTR